MPIPEQEPEIFYEELLPIDGDIDYSSPGGEMDFIEELYDEDFELGTYEEQFYSMMDAENKKTLPTKPQPPKPTLPKSQPTKSVKTKKEDFPKVIIPSVFLPSEGNHKDKKIADNNPTIILPNQNSQIKHKPLLSIPTLPQNNINKHDENETVEISLQVAPTRPKPKVTETKPASPLVLTKPPPLKDYEVLKIPLEVTQPLKNVNAKVNTKSTLVTDDEKEDEYEIFENPYLYLHMPPSKADFLQQQSVPQENQQVAQNQVSGNQRFQQTPLQNNIWYNLANNLFQNQR